MPLKIAEVVVAAVQAYALVGVGFALMFLPRGIARVDPRVAGAPKTLRFLISPGIVALWPLFAWRWITGSHEPTERNPHRSRTHESVPAAARSKELAR